MMVGLSGAALSQNLFRPFDRIYFNKFLQLEGRKFSTSRNHVIWALDIQSQKNINRDLLRAYLCKICPETEEADFLLDDFATFHNAWRQMLIGGLKQCALILKPGVHNLDPDWLEKLNKAYSQQVKAFDDIDLVVADCIISLQEWISLGRQVSTSAQAVTWLVGVSFLGAPVLTSLAADIAKWTGIGALITSADVGAPVSVGDRPLPAITGEDVNVFDLEKLVSSLGPSKMEEPT
ncbi:MAG: class I tRNA ligase family protein [gamma proteobacterium symbiont of Phacoides pectinatus]